jgi:endonuclease III
MKITEKQIQQKIKQYGLSREEAIRSIKVGEKLKQRFQIRF